jgi:hypothetical protein
VHVSLWIIYVVIVMIVPDSVKRDWVTAPNEIELLAEEFQTVRTQLESDLQTVRTQLESDLEEQKQKVLEMEGERYEQNKKIELLEMSHAALIQRIQALENM